MKGSTRSPAPPPLPEVRAAQQAMGMPPGRITWNAIEHLQAAQRELLEGSDQLERFARAARTKIEIQLRTVRELLERQPIQEAAPALAAMLEAERLLDDLVLVLDSTATSSRVRLRRSVRR